MKVTNQHNSFGFTIVELLVVIVVIGILAAVTIVSYTGISNKASLASLQTDLSNASKQLKIFQTINGNYPATISLDCASTPDTTTNKCLKLSSGNTITSLTLDYIVNNTTIPQTFNLTITNTSSSNFGVITNNSKPIIPVSTTAPLSPVADWLAIPTGEHYGNFYDSVSKTYATVTRAVSSGAPLGTTGKTIYDPSTQHIYDVPANKLAINPRSDGKSGSEAVIEEGRTNYLLNSSFETDGNGDGVPDYTSSSTYNGGLGTVLQDKSTYVYGDSSLKIVKTNDIGYLYSTIGSAYLVNGQTYTYSCYVKSDTITADIVMYNYTTWFRANIQSDQLNKWVRLVVPNIIFNGTTGSYNASDIFRHEIIGTKGVAYFDACQIEVGAFATSYIPATTTSVTRNADWITIPTTVWSGVAGTMVSVIGPVRSGVIVADGGSFAGALSITSPANAQMYLYNGGYQGANQSFNNTAYSVIAGSWTSGLYGKVWANGANTVASSIFNANGTWQSPLPIGCHPYSSGWINAPIQRLTVYNSALSDANVLSVTNAIKDGP